MNNKTIIYKFKKEKAQFHNICNILVILFPIDF